MSALLSGAVAGTASLPAMMSTHIAGFQTEPVPQTVCETLAGVLELLPRGDFSRRRVNNCWLVIGDVCRAGENVSGDSSSNASLQNKIPQRTVLVAPDVLEQATLWVQGSWIPLQDQGGRKRLVDVLHQQSPRTRPPSRATAHGRFEYAAHGVAVVQEREGVEMSKPSKPAEQNRGNREWLKVGGAPNCVKGPRAEPQSGALPFPRAE